VDGFGLFFFCGYFSLLRFCCCRGCDSGFFTMFSVFSRWFRRIRKTPPSLQVLSKFRSKGAYPVVGRTWAFAATQPGPHPSSLPRGRGFPKNSRPWALTSLREKKRPCLHFLGARRAQVSCNPWPWGTQNPSHPSPPPPNPPHPSLHRRGQPAPPGYFLTATSQIFFSIRQLRRRCEKSPRQHIG